jgi:hypothetical protein
MTEKNLLDLVPDKDLSPLDKLIKDDNFKNLSSEAKELVWLILNAPQEILDLLPRGRYHSDRLTKKKCQLYLNARWKRPILLAAIVDALVNHVIEELTKWANDL